MSCDKHRLARLTRILGAVAALGACETPSVDAGPPPYDPTDLTGGVLYHWPVGTTIAFHVVPGPTPADDRLASAVRTATERWAAALAYREHSLRLVDDPADADIIVRDDRVAAPVDTDCADTGWVDPAASAIFCPLGDSARTLVRIDGGPGRAKILITVDVAEHGGTTAGLLAIVVHEVGHALGIGGHSPLASDAMFGSPTADSPSRRDALTLRYVLHRRPDLTL